MIESRLRHGLSGAKHPTELAGAASPEADLLLSGDEAVIVPWTRSGSRGPSTTGVFVVSAGRIQCRPVVEVTRVTAIVALSAVAIVGIRAAAGSDGRPAVGPVNMGPGGWVSVRSNGRRSPALQQRRRRPWWARVLHAHRLVAE